MKSKIFVFLLILFVSVFFGCNDGNVLNPTEDVSQISTTMEKPLPNLEAIINADFFLDDPPYFWRGTIDFGGGNEYGLVFISHDGLVHGQSSLFSEEFIIFEPGTDYKDPNNFYLHGSHIGMVINVNNLPEPVKFLANGKVETANAPFDEWLDCNTHARGIVYWEVVNGVPTGFPERAEGTFRIN
jgi:hypothetical protein